MVSSSLRDSAICIIKLNEAFSDRLRIQEDLPTYRADQSKEADFWASDFLWGKATNVSPSPNPVSITTNHSLSRILVEIKPGKGFTDETWAAAAKSIKICDVKTAATIDLSTGVATAAGDTIKSSDVSRES